MRESDLNKTPSSHPTSVPRPCSEPRAGGRQGSAPPPEETAALVRSIGSMLEVQVGESRAVECGRRLRTQLQRSEVHSVKTKQSTNHKNTECTLRARDLFTMTYKCNY